MPRILIGTPTHICKDYAMKRWMKSVGELSYPVEELFLVDNSPGLEYSEYLKTITPKNIKTTVVHIDIPYTDPEERVGVAREEIRKKVISGGFDWWFSWESDVIAPPDSLDNLLKYTNEFKLIHHTSPSRYDPDDSGNSFGLSLVHRDLLEKFGFVLEWGAVDSLMPNCYHGVDSWFNRRVMRSGEGYIELYGVVRPIYHLNE